MSEIRAGDHVFHKPTGETWVVAYVDGDYLAWCGWPEGEAKLADCELVKRASDEEHLRWLNDIANSSGRRASMAKRALAELEATHFPPEAMSGEDILGVWDRHPDFAPGGRWYKS